MARAYSPTEILNKIFQLLTWGLKWVKAFGNPETTGVWFVCGQSTNGKTSFVMEMAKELGSLNMGKVFYNSLEEGTRKTMQDSLIRTGINSPKSNVILGCESLEDLDIRLSKRKSPRIAIIDSIQFTNARTPQVIKFIEKHKATKLLIFISQAEGKEPLGNAAKAIRYLADLKIWIEGFKAISQGRYNAGGTYIIWEQGANNYWSELKN